MATAAPSLTAPATEIATDVKVNTTTASLETKNVVKKLEQFASGTPGGARLSENKQLQKLLTKALRAYKKGDFKSAVLRGLDATRIDENCASACHIVALALEGLGELGKALAMYERAHQLDPTDPDLYMNLSLVAWKLSQIEIAEKFVRLYINMKPGEPSGYNNLGGILRDLGRYEEAIETVRNAIYQFPDQAELWNTLGTIAMEDGNVPDAITFYEESIRLKPKFARALHNIAYAIHHTGPLDDALRYYNNALKYAKNQSDIIEIQHSRGLCQLGLGNLKEGWGTWEVRLDHNFRGSLIYAIDAPRWNGEEIAGKRVLAIGEQGLGDEIMFANAYPDMVKQIGPEGKLIVSCDKRLVELFQRSLPEAEIIPYWNRQHNGKTIRLAPDASKDQPPDYFAPCGETLRYMRDDISRFPKHQNLLVPDPGRVAYWKDKLATLGDGPLIGLCWRSLIMSAKRSKYFSPMEHWAPVFANKDITFVNLQYGDCAEDIAYVKDRFGITIHDFDEIDLKNDLDDNAALCAALDLVLSAPTAASTIAGSVGTEIWLLAIGYVWPMLGEDHYPFFSNNKVFMPDTYADWPNLMEKLGAAVAGFSPSAS